VYRWDTLVAAWKRVRANKGAHGLDRVSIRQFEADWETHLCEIQRKLMERRYSPQPVRRVYIPKSSDPKKRRPIGIPVVADRIVQQAILQIVDPIFDPEMSERSYGFRKGRKAHDAIATAIQDAREGYRHVVDADVFSFFDEIDYDVAMSSVRRRIADGRVLKLFEAFLKAGVMEGGVVTVPKAGTPQGGVISPWIANLVLDDLDKAIEAKGWRHVRYADDFIVLCRSREEAEQALAHVKEVLEGLKLSLHETKTRLTDFEEGFEFLGFRFRHYRLGIAPGGIERLKDKVRTLTRRQQGRNVDAVLADLNPVLRGWARYFGVGEVTHVMSSLDRWIRMRLRAFRFKRKCHHDNWRLPNRRLEKWGLLSLLGCRPALCLSYARAKWFLRAEPGSLQRGNHAGSPSVLTAHAEAMTAS
jgi:group II intron reverse transcriptase/maturase